MGRGDGDAIMGRGDAIMGLGDGDAVMKQSPCILPS